MSDDLNIQELVDELRQNPEDVLKRFRTKRLSPQAVRELGEYLDQPAVQMFLASYSDTPSRFLEEIAARAPADNVLFELAAHARTPRHIMLQLAEKAAVDIRAVLAANRELSPQVASRLAQDGCLVVREVLAANPAVPPRILEMLADDPAAAVRAGLLKQKRLDGDILAKLSRDTDIFVRAAAVVFSPVVNERILEWADTDDELTQLLLLNRPRLGTESLESLCFSNHESVRERAIPRKTLSPDEMVGWLDHGSERMRCLVAGKTGMPAAVQALYAENESATVCAALAGNDELSEAVAVRLAGDGAEEVQLALALNPALPPAALAILCRSASHVVRAALTSRGDLTTEHLRLLVDSGDEEMAYHLAVSEVVFREMPEPLTAQWSRHRLPMIRGLAAASVNLDPDAMTRLARDASVRVRRVIAANPVLPEGFARFLSSDPDPQVAKSATARLAVLQTAAPPAVRQHGEKEGGLVAKLVKRFKDGLTK